METQTSDEHIIVRTHDGIILAKFEDNGNGMEGEIFEGDPPNRIGASELIRIALWILSKAQDRVVDMECS